VLVEHVGELRDRIGIACDAPDRAPCSTVLPLDVAAREQAGGGGQRRLLVTFERRGGGKQMIDALASGALVDARLAPRVERSRLDESGVTRRARGDAGAGHGRAGVGAQRRFVPLDRLGDRRETGLCGHVADRRRARSRVPTRPNRIGACPLAQLPVVEGHGVGEPPSRDQQRRRAVDVQSVDAVRARPDPVDVPLG